MRQRYTFGNRSNRSSGGATRNILLGSSVSRERAARRTARCSMAGNNIDSSMLPIVGLSSAGAARSLPVSGGPLSELAGSAAAERPTSSKASAPWASEPTTAPRSSAVGSSDPTQVRRSLQQQQRQHPPQPHVEIKRAGCVGPKDRDTARVNVCLILCGHTVRGCKKTS